MIPKALLYRLLLLCLCFVGGLELKASLADSLLLSLGNVPDSAKVRNLIRHSSKFLYSDPAAAREYCDKANELALASGDPALLGSATNQKGTLFWAEGKYQEALEAYQQGKKYFVEAEDSSGIAKANNNLGLIYFDISSYDLALEHFMLALPYFEAKGDKAALGTLYNNLANVFARNSDHEPAREYYFKSLKAAEETGNIGAQAMAQNNLALEYKEDDELALALEHFEAAKALFKQIGHQLGETVVLNNIGMVYAKQENFAEAEALHSKAVEIGKRIQNANALQVSYIKLAEICLKTNRPKEALDYARASLEQAEVTTALLEKQAAHEALYLGFKQLGRPDSALVHLIEVKSLSDSIFSAAKAKAINEMHIRYETKLKEGEIERLNQQQKLDAQFRWALVAAILGILVIALLIFLRQKAVMQKDKMRLALQQQQLDAQKAIAAAELAASEAEQRRLQEELEYKRREITQLAMDIAKRHEFLEAMDAELKSLRKDMDEQKLKALSNNVSHTLSLENERQEFLIYIQEEQQNFFRNLDEQFPALSTKDKRLCAMVKLGLSNKEIAAVLNIETSSVEVARHRLRKKLNLETNEDLKAFLEKF